MSVDVARFPPRVKIIHFEYQTTALNAHVHARMHTHTHTHTHTQKIVYIYVKYSVLPLCTLFKHHKDTRGQLLSASQNTWETHKLVPQVNR